MARSADLAARALKESEVSVANHAMRNGAWLPASAEVVALYVVRLVLKPCSYTDKVMNASARACSTPV